jgi:putative tryptophan/tyrosine transport system substrate-binding protein
MSRRILGPALATLLLATVHVAEAEQTKKVPTIGILRPVSSPDWLTEAFQQGLRQLGYIEGRNIVIEYRFAAGREDRLPELAAELVRLNVDVIVASSTPATRAAQDATRTVPIVFVAVSDPVVSGLVASLARPRGNVTGVATEPTPELSGKRLELLKEVVPRVSGVAVLNNPANPASAIVSKETHKAAQKLGLQVHFVDIRNAKDIESAFEAVPRTGANALAVLVDPLFIINQKRIVTLAAKSAFPAIYPWKEFVDAGGLMSYGPSLPDLWRRAAIYVDKILKGAKPADLPLERPMRAELVINLKAAKEIGLAIPPEVLQRADKVIR